MLVALGSHRMIALIPARAGSKRIPGKNTKPLGGIPLLVRAIESARASGLFQTILVSTDDPRAAQLAWQAGVGVHDRKPEHATDDAPDYTWVQDVMTGREEELFAILRPTTPFRDASTIRRAYAQFIASGADSLRAVALVAAHPGKMWRVTSGFRMEPLLAGIHANGQPWHSCPTQILPPYYQQTAGLELAWTRVLQQHHTISGATVCPFLTDARESLDLNTPDEWARAEQLIQVEGPAEPAPAPPDVPDVIRRVRPRDADPERVAGHEIAESFSHHTTHSTPPEST